MFQDFIKNLISGNNQTLPELDARRALGALLVRIARSDGDYAAAEITAIDSVLAKRYRMGPVQTQMLRADCEAIEAQAPDTVRFTRAIKDAVPYDDRIGVIEDLWTIVLADGARDDTEDSIMRMVASLLGVSDQDSHTARLRIG